MQAIDFNSLLELEMINGQLVKVIPSTARFFGLVAIQLSVPSICLANPSPGQPSGHAGVPALYPTKAEAEKVASLHFNCSGAHMMGTQWMPCSQNGHSSGSQ
jgi:hypothetical protein